MHILLKMIEKEIIRHMRWTLFGTWFCFEILIDVDEKRIANRIESGEFVKEIPNRRNLAVRG